MNFSIIGAGKVGTAISCRLISQGYCLSGYCTKTKNSLKRAAYYLGENGMLDPAEAARNADLIIISTPDHVIEETVNNLCSSLNLSGRYIYHVSGGISCSVLAPAEEQGAFAGCIHPLQAFADIETAIDKMEGTYFGLSGAPAAVTKGKEIVKALGGFFLVVNDDKKALYHAAACVASNYLITLLDVAQRTANKAGIPFDVSLKPLLKLMEATLSNVHKYGTERALTGPVSRGSSGIIEDHLNFIEDNLPEITDIYKALGRETVKLSLKDGRISNEQAKQLLNILEQKW